MPAIVIRFIRTPGFVTSAICRVTNSLFDHCEFGVVEDGKLTGWLGAHAGAGVQLMPVDYCQPSFERRYSIPVTEVRYAAWKKYAFSMIGTRYDYLDILGILVRARGLKSPHRVICSQFCMAGLDAASIYPLNVLLGYDHLVTPEMLHLSPIFRGRCIHMWCARGLPASAAHIRLLAERHTCKPARTA
jgi:hypothetical protein